jgi:hypothetical protein
LSFIKGTVSDRFVFYQTTAHSFLGWACLFTEGFRRLKIREILIAESPLFPATLQSQMDGGASGALFLPLAGPGLGKVEKLGNL